MKLVVNNRMKASHFPYTFYNKVYFTLPLAQCAMDEWSPHPDKHTCDMMGRAIESRLILSTTLKFFNYYINKLFEKM